MANIGIYHPDLERGGGAEAVCLHMIDSLAVEHNVSLLTANQPDFASLDNHYGTDTQGTDVQLLGPVAEKLVSGMNLYKIRHAAFARSVSMKSDHYDGIISAFNELTVPGGALQYIHHPLYECSSSPEQKKKRLGYLRDKIARGIAGCEPESGRMLTNSEWMASIIESCRGVRPTVVYPPVKIGESEGRPWDDREDGIVTVGRVAPDKRTGIAIDLVEQLNRRGHDLTLHLVGYAGDNNYGRNVKKRAKESEFVEFHGSIPRGELISILNSNKYGLHTKKYEHFGMAVAEMVASGMLPFVPDSGGQVEIVGRETSLMYSSTEEAIKKIEDVIQSRDRQKELLRSLPNPKSRYGLERFSIEIRSQVDTWLETKS